MRAVPSPQQLAHDLQSVCNEHYALWQRPPLYVCVHQEWLDNILWYARTAVHPTETRAFDLDRDREQVRRLVFNYPQGQAMIMFLPGTEPEYAKNYHKDPDHAICYTRMLGA